MTIKSKVIKFTTAASFAVAGITTLSAAKLNTLSFNHTAQAATVQTPAKEIGVVKVNYKPGQSVTVWNTYKSDKHATGKYLQHESQWKVYQKVKDANSNVWYKLGENEWVSADYVQELATIATTLDLSGQPVSQVPAATVSTTATNVASAVSTTPVQTNTAAVNNTASTATAPVQAPVQTKQVATQAAPAVQNTVNTAATQTVAPAKTQQTYTVSTQQVVNHSAARTYSAPVQQSAVQTSAPKQQAAKPAASQSATTQTARPQTTTHSNSSVAQTVVSAAQSQIGKPYAWGATGPNAYDCSGLVQYAYSQAGKNIGRTTYQQAGAGQHISVGQAQAGDILMWGNYHDAIYVGNNQYVHAPQPGQNVTQASISSYFMPDYAIRVR